MKNYVGEGKTVYVTAPYAVASGQWLKVGSMFGICGAPAAIGTRVALWVEGEYSVTKVGSQAWAEGVKVYWDDSAKAFTSTNVSGSTAAGVATVATGAGASETAGVIRLSGAF